MKLTGREARSYLERPVPRPAVLLHGPEAGAIGFARQKLVDRLLGSDRRGDDMALERLAAAALRKEPALLVDQMRARGFFGAEGQRIVLVEDAGDALAPAFETAFAMWQEGDAMILATAGALPPRSKLRKLFESHPSALAIGIYPEPPGPREIAEQLAGKGLKEVEGGALQALAALGAGMEPGEFAGLLEKLALYKLYDPVPLTEADVEAMAVPPAEAEMDAVLDLAAEGRVQELAALLPQIGARSGAAVSLAIAAARHFQRLHALASDPEGPGRAAQRLRPPVFGPRRDRLVRQAGRLGPARIERILRWIAEADLAIRAPNPPPAGARIERLLLRIAMLARR